MCGRGLKKRELTMKENNSLEMACPYCSNPDLFAAPLSAQGGREVYRMGFARRGKFWKRVAPKKDNQFGMHPAHVRFYGDHWRATIEGDHFVKRFAKYQLELIGFPYPSSPALLPYRDMFHHSLFFCANLTPDRRAVFNVCRVSHRDSPVMVDVHQWPSHRTLITVRGLDAPEWDTSTQKIISEAMEFFRVETRGDPKINEDVLAKTIERIGAGATQKEAAKAIGVTPQALRQWAARRGLQDWQTVKEKHARVEAV